MPDKKVEFNPEKISIEDFKLIKGQVETPENFIVEKVEGHFIDNRLEAGFNFEGKLIKADFFVEISTDSKGGNQLEAKGSFRFVFIFKVSDLDLLTKVDEQEKSITMDYRLANAIASITYSTSRGVLLTRLQGTAFQNFILPVINPNKLFPSEG